MVLRSPLAIKTKFNFLSSDDHQHSNSAKELAKFDFSPPQSSNVVCHDSNIQEDHALVHTEKVIFGSFQSDIPTHNKGNNSIRFGNFQSVFTPDNQEHQSTFIGSNYWSSYWDSIPTFILLHIMDFRQARYDDSQIVKNWALDSVPSADFIFNKANICSWCKQLGHLGPNCTSQAIEN